MRRDSADIETLRQSSVFDAAWYLVRSPDVAAAGIDPAVHYVTSGWSEGREPNRFFDSAWYLATYPDVALAGVNPLLHYLAAGEQEGRWPCRIFDPHWYSSHYELPCGAARALAHYLTVGEAEHLQPNEIFDPLYYLRANPDLRQATVKPAQHYLRTGYRELRRVGLGFSTAWYREQYLAGDQSIDPVHHYLTVGRARGCRGQPEPSRGSVADQIRHFTNAGPDHEDFAPRIAAGGQSRARLIAFYLPQFHRIPENDRWWGAGFTEWRNVQRGLPRFVGHYQPRIPKDLGHYDLSDPNVLRDQIHLARAAGLHGFCFYYYNFNGRRLLEKPVEHLLANKSLDFPFCLMWTNENWTRRWDGLDDDVLIRQEYHPARDRALLEDLSRHFSDRRYIHVGNRPLFIIYRPGRIPEAERRIARWRRIMQEEFGHTPWLLMAQAFGDLDPRVFGLDGAVEFPPHKIAEVPSINTRLRFFDSSFSGEVRAYDNVVARSLNEEMPPYRLIKTLCPSWDNDCRRQGAGFTLHGATPQKYERWLDQLVDRACRHPFEGEPLLFVNAWNEWAEGAYLEPDVYYGSAYLNATARALLSRSSGAAKVHVVLVGHDAHPHGAQMNLLNIGRMMARRFGVEITWLLLAGGDLLPDFEEIGDVIVAGRNSTELSTTLARLQSSGAKYAITNTLVTGAVVPELRRYGFRVVSLVHELSILTKQYSMRAPIDSEHLYRLIPSSRSE